jgi:hypothetical protein
MDYLQFNEINNRLHSIEKRLDSITQSSLHDAKRDNVIAAVRRWMASPYYNKEGAWEEVIDAMNEL